jgi:hypothetical protein
MCKIGRERGVYIYKQKIKKEREDEQLGYQQGEKVNRGKEGLCGLGGRNDVAEPERLREGRERVCVRVEATTLRHAGSGLVDRLSDG